MNRSRSSQRPRSHTLGAIAAGVLLLAGLWTGCTVTKENYATLSRFFDGVPVPGGVQGPDGEIGVERIVIVSSHEPYLKEQCGDCHNTGRRLNRNSSAVCLPCHEQVPTQHEWTHGPVAAGACLWCHSPHESAFPKLMRDADRKVCTQCHTADSLDDQRTPAHADETRACLECHFGHGGPDRFLLRSTAAQPAPAGTQK